MREWCGQRESRACAGHTGNTDLYLCSICHSLCRVARSWAGTVPVPQYCRGQLGHALWPEEEEEERLLHLHSGAKPGSSTSLGQCWQPLAVWDHLSKAPHGLPCSTSQDTHLDYVVAAAHLFAQAHRVPPCRDRVAIQAILRDVVLPPFAPQEGLQIPLTEELTEEAQVPTGEVPRYVPGSSQVVVGLWLLVPAPAPKMTQTKVRGTPATVQEYHTRGPCAPRSQAADGAYPGPGAVETGAGGG